MLSSISAVKPYFDITLLFAEKQKETRILLALSTVESRSSITTETKRLTKNMRRIEVTELTKTAVKIRPTYPIQVWEFDKLKVNKT